MTTVVVGRPFRRPARIARSTAGSTDEVLFLEGGRIADRGAHPDLMARNATYAGIVSAYDQVWEPTQ
jgi:hypothetical protein